MSSDLEALARLLRVAPESQTADDADEEGRRLEAFAMDLATAKATAGDDRASTETFCALVQGRLLSRAYRLPPGAPGAASPGSVLRVVQCVRLMLRHGPFVARLGEIAGAAEALGDKFRAYADLHRAHRRRLARRARGWRPRRGLGGRGCAERDVAVRVPRGDFARARVRVQEGGDDAARRRARRNGRVVDA
jgi:hypothetical protein